MINKRNFAMVAIAAIALSVGAAGIVTSIGQVAHATTKIGPGDNAQPPWQDPKPLPGIVPHPTPNEWPGSCPTC